MVKGVGIDVVSLPDFAERLSRTPDLKGRLFTEREIGGAYSLESLAGKFAIKEAVLKALGTGLTGGISWKDVEVLGGKDRPPYVVLHGKAREVAKGLELRVSVSHTKGIVVGICVAVSSGT